VCAAKIDRTTKQTSPGVSLQRIFIACLPFASCFLCHECVFKKKNPKSHQQPLQLQLLNISFINNPSSGTKHCKSRPSVSSMSAHRIRLLLSNNFFFHSTHQCFLFVQTLSVSLNNAIRHTLGREIKDVNKLLPFELPRFMRNIICLQDICPNLITAV